MRYPQGNWHLPPAAESGSFRLPWTASSGQNCDGRDTQTDLADDRGDIDDTLENGTLVDDGRNDDRIAWVDSRFVHVGILLADDRAVRAQHKGALAVRLAVR